MVRHSRSALDIAVVPDLTERTSVRQGEGAGLEARDSVRTRDCVAAHPGSRVRCCQSLSRRGKDYQGGAAICNGQQSKPFTQSKSCSSKPA